MTGVRRVVFRSKDAYESHIEEETLNCMIPIWKKNKKDLKQEEYNQFCQEKFFDYEEPLRTIHTFAEGQCSYYALLYIPSHASYDYYSKEFEKGLSLYANGVMTVSYTHLDVYKRQEMHVRKNVRNQV